MRTKLDRPRILRFALGAGILALVLTGTAVAAHAEGEPELIPVVTSGPLPAGTVGVYYEFQLTSNVSPVTYSVSGLPPELQADAQTGLISGTPLVDGEYTVRLEAIHDATDPGGTQVRFDTLVISPAPVTTPVITSPSLPNGAVGQPYTFQVTANVSPVTFSITDLPPGLSADAQSGLITGTPTVDGQYSVRLVAIGADPGGEESQVVFATVVIDPAPVTTPVITSPPLPDGTVGQPYSFHVTSNVSPVTFSITQLPPGLSADAQSGLISGTPTLDGEFSVRLEAIGTDTSGGQSQVVFEAVTIAPSPGTVPVITSGPLPDGVAGVPYSFQLVASDPGATFSASGLPAGLRLDATTGMISGTPTAAGSYAVTVIPDVEGRSGTPVTSTITIQPPTTPPIDPPVFAATPLATATVGSAFSFTPSVTSTTPVEFTLTGGVPGLTFDPVTGTLAGTPTTAGVFSVTITATNGAPVPATLTFTVTVAPAPSSTPPTQNPPASTIPAAAAPTIPSPANQTAPHGAPSSRASSLADTGTNGRGVSAAIVIGALLLLTGAGLAVSRRRRRGA